MDSQTKKIDIPTLEQTEKESGQVLGKKNEQVKSGLPKADKKITKPLSKKVPKKNIFAEYLAGMIFLVVIVVFGGLYLFISPLLAEYNEVNNDVIEMRQSELEKQKKVLGELMELNDIYEGVSPYLKDRINKFLPEDPDLPNLYFNINEIAKSAGYKIESIDVLVEEEKDKNKKTSIKKQREIEISVIFEGAGYGNFKNLINLIEKNLRLFDVQTFGYNPEEETVGLTLKTYFYK
jgi:Tfp pilus assembly protein PilO